MGTVYYTRAGGAVLAALKGKRDTSYERSLDRNGVDWDVLEDVGASTLPEATTLPRAHVIDGKVEVRT